MNRLQMTKNEVILPKMNTCKGDLSGNWYVYFSVLDPSTGKMKTYRKYDGFSEIKDTAGRKKHGHYLMRKWREKLLSGWNPIFEQDKVRYASLLRYDYDTRREESETESTKNFEYYSSRYLKFAREVAKIRPASYTTYKSKLRIFGQFLVKEKIESFHIRFYNLNTIREFNNHLIKDRKLEGKSLNDYNEALSRFFKYVIKEEKILTKNPVDDIQQYKEQGRHHKTYNGIYIELLKKEISKYDE